MNKQTLIDFFSEYSIYNITRLNDMDSFNITVYIAKNWEIPKDLTIEGVNVAKNKETDNFIFVNFINDGVSVDETLDMILNINKYNREKERREKLYKQKLLELQKLVETTDIDELENISFIIEDALPKKPSVLDGEDSEPNVDVDNIKVEETYEGLNEDEDVKPNIR